VGFSGRESFEEPGIPYLKEPQAQLEEKQYDNNLLLPPPED